jgi:hypothetical protein
MLDMLLGAILYALGLWSGVFLCRRKPVTPAAPPDKFAKYRDPKTGLLSARMVEKQKGEPTKGR